MKSKRFKILSERPVNKETFILPWPEAGLINTGSPTRPATEYQNCGRHRNRDRRGAP